MSMLLELISRLLLFGIWTYRKEKPAPAPEIPVPPEEGFKLSERSLGNLEGVHPDMVRVVKRAIRLTSIDFIVTEGLRSKERQRKLLAAGRSKTMRSRHLTGHAVDIVALMPDGNISYDFKTMTRISKYFKMAAEEENVRMTWGGDWKSFKDTPHYQLKWKEYPA